MAAKARKKKVTRKRKRKAGRPAGKSSEQSRAELVQAAIEAIAQTGLASTTLVSIAERAGSSKTTLLHHFGSRDGLVAAIGMRSFEVFADRFAHALRKPSKNLEETADRILDLVFVESSRAYLSVMLQLLARASHDSLVSDGIRAAVDQRILFLETVLGFPREVGRPAAGAILAAVQGAIDHWLSCDPEDPETYREWARVAVHAIIADARKKARRRS